MTTTSEDSGSSTVGIEKRLGRIERQLEGVAAMAAVQPNGPFGYQAQPDADEIDLLELWNVVWKGKWVIIATTVVFTVLAVFYALSLPNIYRSEALLAPAEENSGGGLAGMAGNLGGLASLAGVRFGKAANDKTTLAIEVLKSREFLSKFIEKHDLLVPLMAAKGWDRGNNEIIIDPDIYNFESNKWVRKPTSLRKAKPSMQEAFKVFVRKFNVSQDKDTSFVSLSVEHYSPSLAKAWVDFLVRDINEVIKARDVAEAQKSIAYLTEQLSKTAVADMQAVFYELIEEQTKTVMFAEVRDEYVFKTIDSAVVPELKAKPKKALICILGLLLGGMLSVFYVLVRHFLGRSRGHDE